jgi:uncharacterized membrane protein YccF (DUF307 family)
MKTLGNLLWLILGGLLVAVLYVLVGLVMCITIIGIPFGIQLFKLGSWALWPFGRELVDAPGEPGCLSIVMNVIWLLLGWWEIALVHLFFGLLLCITIIGIPWGVQHLKMALGSLIPFGKELRDIPEKR